MQQITNLKDRARQTFRVQVTGGDTAEFFMYYLPSQRGWYFDITYGTFTATGLHLVNSFNVLNAYFNLLRFGLFCEVIDGSEPYFVDDFSTGRVKLYITDESEARFLESLYND